MISEKIDWRFQSVFFPAFNFGRDWSLKMSSRQAEVNDDIEESPWFHHVNSWDALSNSVKIARSNDVDLWIERIDSWDFVLIKS